MAWNKSRYQPTLVVPIDSLLKEKENANRPTISAVGTVGKWGITSFTSIRNTPYGYNQYSPQDLEQVTSPGATPKSPTDPVVEAPKPRKFFKSRNATATDTTAAAQLLSSLAAYKQQQQLMATPQAQSTSKAKKVKKSGEKKVKKRKRDDDEESGEPEEERKPKSKKKSRKSATKVLEDGGDEAPVDDATTSVAVETKRTKSRKKSKHIEPEAVSGDNEDDDDAGDEVKFRTKITTESQNPNKRYLSRNRGKVVNYNETGSRSPTPDKRMVIAMTTPKDAGHPKEVVIRSNSVVAGTGSQANADHPPIVLRISKGTSRLISTDSEELNGVAGSSPSQQPPKSAAEQVQQSVGELSSTAELLAVLSDNAFVSPNTPPTALQPVVEPPAILSPTVATTPEASAQIFSPVVEQPERLPSPVPEVVDKPYAPLKIKIKTDVIKRYERETARKIEKLKKRSPEQNLPPPAPVEPTPPPVEEPATRATRASKRQVTPAEASNKKSASTPQPGTDNYELYRTLTSPTTEERYFDSQSSVLGSSNTQQIARSRDSSEVPSDFDASQHSSLAAAPPSDVEVNFDTEEDEQRHQQQTSSGTEMTITAEKPTPKRSKQRVQKLVIKSPLKETNETIAPVEVAPTVLEIVAAPAPVAEEAEANKGGGRRSRRQAATGINYTELTETVLEAVQNENRVELSSPPAKRGRKKAVVETPVAVQEEQPAVVQPEQPVIENPVAEDKNEEVEVPLSKLKGRRGRKPVLQAAAPAVVEEEKVEPKGVSPKKPKRGPKSKVVVEEEPSAVSVPAVIEPEPEPEPEPALKGRPTRKGRTKQPVYAEPDNEAAEPDPSPEPTAATRRTRNTRNNNTMNNNQIKVATPIVEEPPPVVEPAPENLKLAVPKRTFARKRKNQPDETEAEPITAPVVLSPTSADQRLKGADESHSTAKQSKLESPQPQPQHESPVVVETNQKEKEYKKLKLKKSWLEKQNNESSAATLTTASNSVSMGAASTVENLSTSSSSNNNIYGNNSEPVPTDGPATDDDQQPSVKLVISKKKGTFFKSRALVDDAGTNKKRHVYRHKWDDDEKDKTLAIDPATTATAKASQNTSVFDDDFDGEGSGLTRVTKPKNDEYNAFDDDEENAATSVRCGKKAKPYYTVVRNVKKAHQIQEIGEYQEMDDDVEYILSALQTDNPMSTRCLSAIQLASKCTTPGFRMHVRAHGVVSKFFKALKDATKDQSLALCTATIMFVLSQDTLNMDLDPDSLELMLNLLDSDASHKSALNDCGLSKQQLEKNKQKVRELCEEIKNSGKGVHLNLDNITAGTLAMETLLSLTSKRAGEWFKEELRELGGLAHIMKTICDCCHQITDYVVEWTDVLLDKLRKIERCLRILENVTQLNEQNQNYILHYNGGETIDTLVKLYKLCDSEIGLYPTNNTDAPKDSPGIVLRDALVPTLKVLINLTHPFNDQAIGSSIIGSKSGIIDTSLHILFETTNYIPESSVFDLSILVLLLLINLTQHTQANRQLIMDANAPSDFKSVYTKVPAIKELVEYFYKCEELAVQAEQNTDDLLDNPKKSTEKKMNVQEEVEETVTKILQKAGHHMEHTMTASYVCLLIGHLVLKNKENKRKILQYLKNGKFTEMTSILGKYYNFLNLTASAEATIVAHVKATKNMVDYLNKCDLEDDNNEEPHLPVVPARQPPHHHHHQYQPQVHTSAHSTTSAAPSSASLAYDRLRFGASASSAATPSTSSGGGSSKQRFLIN